MIARPKISRNEWKTAEIGASEVGNVALLSCPGDDVRLVARADLGPVVGRVAGAVEGRRRRVGRAHEDDAVAPLREAPQREAEPLAREAPQKEHDRRRRRAAQRVVEHVDEDGAAVVAVRARVDELHAAVLEPRADAAVDGRAVAVGPRDVDAPVERRDAPLRAAPAVGARGPAAREVPEDGARAAVARPRPVAARLPAPEAGHVGRRQGHRAPQAAAHLAAAHLAAPAPPGGQAPRRSGQPRRRRRPAGQGRREARRRRTARRRLAGPLPHEGPAAAPGGRRITGIHAGRRARRPAAPRSVKSSGSWLKL